MGAGACSRQQALLKPRVAGAAPTKITFLHINDVYGIAPTDGQGGFTELMTLLRRERAVADFSVTTFGGDLIPPSVMSGLTKGAHMIDLINLIGTDIAGGCQGITDCPQQTATGSPSPLPLRGCHSTALSGHRRAGWVI